MEAICSSEELWHLRTALRHYPEDRTLDNVTDWAVARRRRDKHVPTNPHPTIERRPFLGNRPINTNHSNDCAIIERRFSMESAPRSYVEDN
jgi:hypothetical protein